ncbi:hypothetical protein V5E97_27155 [Singulisphaera sp. Ch08]|uniref:RecJ OB domain-containing protein n=1 Tax=Singulisphaera sp. Ch08 TaxID=3120278 RepID=A0AAU7CA24_9BACT
MSNDWRERLREKLEADPLASSGPPFEVTGVVDPLDDETALRAAGMELKYNATNFLGFAPRHLRLLNFGTTPVQGGQVEMSLRFRYYRSGSIGDGLTLADETSEADFNDLP